MHPAHKTGEHNLFEIVRGKAATLNWFSFLEDDGVYRMWYECYDVEGWPTINDTSFCYCESKDGIHWTKPELGLFEYQGSKAANNVLFRQIVRGGAFPRSWSVRVYRFLMPPESRYKAISQGMFPTPPDYRIAGMYSPDGIKWTRYPKPICNLFADSQFSGFWDDSKKKYSIYGRVPHRGLSVGSPPKVKTSNTSPIFRWFSPRMTMIRPKVIFIIPPQPSTSSRTAFISCSPACSSMIRKNSIFDWQ